MSAGSVAAVKEFLSGIKIFRLDSCRKSFYAPEYSQHIHCTPRLIFCNQTQASKHNLLRRDTFLSRNWIAVPLRSSFLESEVRELPRSPDTLPGDLSLPDIR
jgi:hypothetical protein